jgi:hypothetical protein
MLISVVGSTLINYFLSKTRTKGKKKVFLNNFFFQGICPHFNKS